MKGGRHTVRLREERNNHDNDYCLGIGCDKKLTTSRYTEHYCTRDCYIHTFHLLYNEKVDLHERIF